MIYNGSDQLISNLINYIISNFLISLISISHPISLGNIILGIWFLISISWNEIWLFLDFIDFYHTNIDETEKIYGV